MDWESEARNDFPTQIRQAGVVRHGTCRTKGRASEPTESRLLFENGQFAALKENGPRKIPGRGAGREGLFSDQTLGNKKFYDL